MNEIFIIFCFYFWYKSSFHTSNITFSLHFNPLRSNLSAVIIEHSMVSYLQHCMWLTHTDDSGKFFFPSSLFNSLHTFPSVDNITYLLSCKVLRMYLDVSTRFSRSFSYVEVCSRLERKQILSIFHYTCIFTVSCIPWYMTNLSLSTLKRECDNVASALWVQGHL